MKHLFKILFILGIVAFVAGLFFFISMVFFAKGVREEINSTAHVVIAFKEEIPGLQNVELQICDQLTSYTLQSIKDTVSENVAVPYNDFPCSTTFRYAFADGTSKKIPAEKFNCTGCSGTHSYELSRDTIHYTYFP